MQKLLGEPAKAPRVHFVSETMNLNFTLEDSDDIELLNMCVERSKQIQMKRTFNRPLK